MGQQCTSCCEVNSNNEFAQQNFNIKNKEDYRIASNNNSQNYGTPAATNANHSQANTKVVSNNNNNKNNDGTIGPEEEQKVIKMQALVRGHLSRRKTMQEVRVSMTSQGSTNKPHFSDLDYYATLTGNNDFDVADLNDPNKMYYKEHYYEKTGSNYKGQWVGNFRHGQGSIEFSDGASYEGNWYLGRAEGQGTFKHTNGDVYEGSWVQDRAQGHGTHTNFGGGKYEGGWFRDRQDGVGREELPDGSSFEGNFSQGKKEGYGIYRWSDGTSYEGEWNNNQINGFGTYAWIEGRKYVGFWQDSMMHGFGFYTSPDGRTYEGFFVDDKKQGYGIQKWGNQNGNCYKGTWFQNKQFGFAKLQFEGGKLKYTIWKEGKKLTTLRDEDMELYRSGKVDFQIVLEVNDEIWEQISSYSEEFEAPEQFAEAQQHYQICCEQQKAAKEKLENLIQNQMSKGMR